LLGIAITSFVMRNFKICIRTIGAEVPIGPDWLHEANMTAAVFASAQAYVIDGDNPRNPSQGAEGIFLKLLRTR
jgi:hypothetical protein